MPYRPQLFALMPTFRPLSEAYQLRDGPLENLLGGRGGGRGAGKGRSTKNIFAQGKLNEKKFMRANER